MNVGRSFSRRLFVILVCLAALVVVPTATATPSTTAGTGTWSVTGSLQTARFYHTATLLPNGKVLVAGGLNGSCCPATGVVLVSAELYDPATGLWTPTGNLHVARFSHVTTLLPNGKVLVAGGEDLAGNALASTELYDSATGTWTLTDSMHVPRFGQGQSLLPDGHLLVVGGWQQNTFITLNSAEIYDPATATWTVTGSMQTARAGPAISLLSTGKVLVASGVTCCPYVGFASAELYDPTRGSWSYTGSMHTVRAEGKGVLLLNGEFLITAGSAGVCCPWTGGQLTSTEIYDPATSTWLVTGSLNIAGDGATPTRLPNGQVLVEGGGTDTAGPLASTEVYSLGVGTWAMSGNLTTARSLHTATLLRDGRVLVTGGQSSSRSALSSAEVYTPAAVGTLLASPARAIIGQALTLSGSHFGYVEPISIYADSTTSTPLYATTTTTAHTFVLHTTVVRSLHGPHTLIAVGQSSHLVGTTPFVGEARLVLQPASGRAGTTVGVSGYGFGALEPINVYWASPGGTLVRQDVSTSQGVLTTFFKVPSTAASGVYTVTAFGQTTGTLGVTQFTVP